MAVLRQTLVNAVLAKFQTITVANGYHSNVGQKFWKWRRAPLNDGDFPAGILIDRIDEIVKEGLGGGSSRTDHRLEFHVHLFVKSGTSDDTLRQIVADVYKAIGADDTFGVTGVIQSNPLGDELEAVHDGVKVADALVKFETIYRTVKWQET